MVLTTFVPASHTDLEWDHCGANLVAHTGWHRWTCSMAGMHLSWLSCIKLNCPPICCQKCGSAVEV